MNKKIVLFFFFFFFVKLVFISDAQNQKSVSRTKKAALKI